MNQEQIHAMLSERTKTHGDYEKVARISQSLKNYIREQASKERLTYAQQEALDMIMLKIARILCGNACHADHWIDIGGYATLAADRCNQDAG